MTDLENFRNMLIKTGIAFEEDSFENFSTYIEVDGQHEVFYTTFKFDLDGKLVAVKTHE